MRTWKCPACGHTEEIGYDWLAEHGGPVCPDCDCDMELMPEALSTGPDRLAIDRLVEQAEAAGFNSEDLDESVHAVASDIAAAINDGGLDEQIEYLCREMGSVQTAKALSDLIEERQRKAEDKAQVARNPSKEGNDDEE